MNSTRNPHVMDDSDLFYPFGKPGGAPPGGRRRRRLTPGKRRGGVRESLARAARVLELNPYHEPPGSAVGGRFARRPDNAPVAATSAAHAARMVAGGKHVRLKNVKQVATMLDRLGAMARDAMAKGDAAPNYDLCKVSVAGTNLFCSDHKGIARIDMPQLKGQAVPGTRAAGLVKGHKGEADGTGDFQAHMKRLGVRVTKERVRSAELKASQMELVGPKVAGMMRNKDFDPAGERIFISRDGYVVDGHHRWAASVGRDSIDGRLGDHSMRVYRVDMDILPLLQEANRWATEFGIAPKKAAVKESAPPSAVRLVPQGPRAARQGYAPVRAQRSMAPPISKRFDNYKVRLRRLAGKIATDKAAQLEQEAQ